MSTCATCAFWQDHSDRVYAKVAAAPNGPVSGLHELRACRYQAPPIQQLGRPGPFNVVYTDKDFGCSAHKEAHK